MSRFFATKAVASDSDSDFSSSDEELLSSSEEEELLSSSEEEESKAESEDEDDDDSIFGSDSDNDLSSDDDDGPRGASYFLKKSTIKDSDDESSDDEGRKVVRSAKDKLIDDIENGIAAIENYTLINSWTQILTEFDNLHKSLPKAQKQNITIPISYIKAIANLDQSIQDQDKDAASKKKLNASTAKSFNTLKQRVKKQIREFQSKVDEYRADPEGFGTKKDGDEEAEVADSDITVLAQKKASPGTTAASQEIFQTLRSIQESRGKKNVDKHEQIKLLEDSLDLTELPFELISIYLNLIPLRFDLFSNVSYMPVDQWKNVYDRISTLFKILEDNKSSYRVLETAKSTDDIDIQPTPNAEGVREILGSIPSLVERLDDELTKSLQVIDPHSTEYIERLKDETKIYELIVRCQLYCESAIPKDQYSEKAGEQLARVILRRVEHIYYKPVGLIISTENTTWNKLSPRNSLIYAKYDSSASVEEASYSNGLLDSLCSVLYTQSNSIFRKKAMLCHIYYYAFNDDFYKARDMFLMSHLQSTIASSDPTLQVLFNRSLVQLGLCAFRSGLIGESHQLLQEIATSTRSKELLGQSGQRYQQQQSLADKQRLLPFHMHINLELLECTFLTASLLLEVPSIATTSKNEQQKQHNAVKTFKRALEYHDRQFFQGPPESTKDYVMHAAKALQKGNWLKASELLNSIKIWNLFNKADDLKKMLTSKLQIEGLRTYLFTYKNHYEKLLVSQLAKIFELSEQKVNSVISKMIFEEEINAALDQKTNSIIFIQGIEVSKLQELAILLADRASQLAERNERLAAGGHQNSTLSSHQPQQSNNTQQHNHSNHNIKFAPVTGALQSAPGTISGGALNGMDRRRKNQNRK